MHGQPKLMQVYPDSDRRWTYAGCSRRVVGPVASWLVERLQHLSPAVNGGEDTILGERLRKIRESSD